MSFSIYNLGKFKQGQFDITEDCKNKSETGNIVSIFDGDVTTYIYEKTDYFKLDDLREFIIEVYGEGCGSWLATYKEDDADIFVQFDGSVDGIVDDLCNVCFKDENGNEEYWEVFVGDKSELLCTSAFMSENDVLKEYPYLQEC